MLIFKKDIKLIQIEEPNLTWVKLYLLITPIIMLLSYHVVVVLITPIQIYFFPSFNEKKNRTFIDCSNYIHKYLLYAPSDPFTRVIMFL